MQSLEENKDQTLIPPDKIVETVTQLKIRKDFQYNLLLSITGTDYSEYFEVTYHLYSTKFNRNVVLKCRLDKSNPEIDSISSVYAAANWHERETYDLIGIKFKNHPDLKRILLPDDWQGHPLRKDYVMNDVRLSWNER